jgi:hypothetical protein
MDEIQFFLHFEELKLITCSKLCHFFFHFGTAIDAPGGFLMEWWSVFWDIFIARMTIDKHSDVAASYLEVCFL